jgi:hypothetical protein
MFIHKSEKWKSLEHDVHRLLIIVFTINLKFLRPSRRSMLYLVALLHQDMSHLRKFWSLCQKSSDIWRLFAYWYICTHIYTHICTILPYDTTYMRAESKTSISRKLRLWISRRSGLFVSRDRSIVNALFIEHFQIDEFASAILNAIPKSRCIAIVSYSGATGHRNATRDFSYSWEYLDYVHLLLIRFCLIDCPSKRDSSSFRLCKCRLRPLNLTDPFHLVDK